MLELRVLRVAVEVGTTDLDTFTTVLLVGGVLGLVKPGENFASLLIWNSSLLREQILSGDSPFCSGWSRAYPFCVTRHEWRPGVAKLTWMLSKLLARVKLLDHFLGPPPCSNTQ